MPWVGLPAVMRITSNGQVTIPRRIRDRYGLMPGTAAEFVIDGDKVWLQSMKRAKHSVDDWLMRATGVLKGKTTTAQIRKRTRG